MPEKRDTLHWATLLLLLLNATADALPHDSQERLWAQYQRNQASQATAAIFPHGDCFRRAAESHGLPVTLLLAVARGESDFDAKARSSAGALGLMQILWPGTARHLGLQRREQLFEPCTNVDAGARYLDELIDRYDGNLHRALAAYNYGPGRIPRQGGTLPAGAEWYSGYIYRHLHQVLERDTGGGDYGSERKRLVIAFNQAYRAQSFTDSLQRRAPGVRLDWFRTGAGRFQVVLLYAGANELRRGRRLLHDAGIVIN